MTPSATKTDTRGSSNYAFFLLMIIPEKRPIAITGEKPEKSMSVLRKYLQATVIPKRITTNKIKGSSLLLFIVYMLNPGKNS
jgi:hypothetical protein